MLKKKKRKKKETKILSNQRLCFKVSLPYLRSSIVDVISLSIINCNLDLIQCDPDVKKVKQLSMCET